MNAGVVLFFLSITLPGRAARWCAHLGLTAVDSLNAEIFRFLSGGFISNVHDEYTVYLDIWKYWYKGTKNHIYFISCSPQTLFRNVPVMNFKLYCNYSTFCVLSKAQDQIQWSIVPKLEVRGILCFFVLDINALVSPFFFLYWKCVPITLMCILNSICVLILSRILSAICKSQSLTHLNHWLIFTGLFSRSLVEGYTTNTNTVLDITSFSPLSFSPTQTTYCQGAFCPSIQW